ncbi:5-formyltetrahydrofolate cyclo-ligase [Bdellovibrio sp. HCB337]|uniref:5-formyltetrahydrofolate cyclo-ligase n=1 Tax=Bdellovibrio sp. HCB337 TaxID=3394358 RepID=UPI0039A4A523
MSLRKNNVQAADGNMSSQPTKRLTKRQWRDHLKALLQKESPHSSVQISHQICENLTEFLADKKGVWAGYLALPQEPDLNPVFRHSLNIEWAYPRMEADHLVFYISQNFIKGPFGVMEPSEDSQKLSLDELDGILVPGLGFNKKGRRLGKGRGFYDRALADYKGPKIGVCFDCQVVEEDLPEEEHDIRVDALVTEEAIIQCK